MNNPISQPPDTFLEKEIAAAVGKLLPLYSDTEKDAPDSVLSRYPSASRIVEALQILIDVVLPGRMTQGDIGQHGLERFLRHRLKKAGEFLVPEISKALPFRWQGASAQAEGAQPEGLSAQDALAIVRRLFDQLESLRKYVIEDVQAAYDGDPAALTYAEVQLAYPGLLAIVSHRLAHELYTLNVPVIPRVMSEWTHARTGTDIHPGARIGRGFFIDHATGVVVGETCVIGNRVKVYQGVTLGAKNFPLDEQGRPIKHIKRHPTVEDEVVIYANAIILGGTTVIGRRSTIGGNVFLMESVPPNSFVSNVHPELHIKAAATPSGAPEA